MRENWHDFYLELTKQIATRSTCIKRKVGAIIVSDKRILSTGYNGAPSRIEHCTETTCLRKNVNSGEQLDNCVATHAEANAIANAARHGVSIKDASLYCTTKPCLPCYKLLINAGIKKIYYIEDYSTNDVYKFLLHTSNLTMISQAELKKLSEETEYRPHNVKNFYSKCKLKINTHYFGIEDD